MTLDDALVRRLVDAQFPQWSHLPIRQVIPGGWDNRTFRLGDELLVRLPSADGYMEAVAKEQRWLPVIAARVPFEIPEPVALGEPTDPFPRPWSVYRWIDGEPYGSSPVPDLTEFALDVARFCTALSRVDPTDGPLPGTHSFWRGAHPRVYDDDVQRSLRRLDGVIDVAMARGVWDAALQTQITAPPVWFHGDVAPGNLLLRNGRLAAVIDFGTSGIGDPACDLAIAWTVLDPPAREAFCDALPWTDDVWVRGRAWALWKAMLVLAGDSGAHDVEAEARASSAVIDRILYEPD